ncbi:hypothetical protein ElyMa_003185900 [Elysia marginata]|uniref:P-type ATPase C-terminal domain-containing protein n=1 Tax=Elysia marginata TaxID=1093978 RepID=A0AAV4IZ25_9GAST|nr:hypothetical protein ElyMa_003185900 [Elysia marginata]
MEAQIPDWAAKASWMLHFTLFSWALTSGFITVQTFTYSQLVFFMVGAWFLVDKASVDAALLFFCTILITILNDIIVLSIYTPRGYRAIEDGKKQDICVNIYNR